GPVFSSTNFILTRAPIVETSFTDSLHPADQGWHTYLVYAVDQHNNRSRKGSEVRARAIDKYPPSAPELKSISESNGIITLNWEQFPTGDLKEFIVVSKRKDSGNFIEEKRTGQLSADLKIPEDGYYSFWIIAQDSSGNQSEKSSSLSIDYLREKQLPAPTSGNAVKDGNKVIIMWKPSESNQIKGIFIRRKNLTTGESKDIGEFAKTENQFRDLYILPGNNYRYEVMSFDQDFLFSAPLIIEYPKKK
ncbi:MAG: hypothetical protein IT223_06740, partial [Crocinitomicaceae bacterium]|nr:hypothetical protein [Crocinitomicaceae bacterium]